MNVLIESGFKIKSGKNSTIDAGIIAHNDEIISVLKMWIWIYIIQQMVMQQSDIL